LYARLQQDQEDHDARLGLARVFWASSAREQSLLMYQELIEAHVLQGEVVDALQRNAATFENPDWHRALGDAYMNVSDLVNALEAYREALTQL